MHFELWNLLDNLLRKKVLQFNNPEKMLIMLKIDQFLVNQL